MRAATSTDRGADAWTAATAGDTTPGGREQAMLRWAVTAYLVAQGDRIRYGEQLRAILQGRDPKWGIAPLGAEAVEQELERIRAHGGGPVPVLGSLYARASAHEHDLARQMHTLVARHPVWSWLSAVRGVGPTLAARLLACLDIDRARTASSFWAFCGLATIPAMLFRCASCGATTVAPAGTRLTASHVDARSGGKHRCTGAFVAAGPAAGRRVAEPRPRRGERSRYSFEAKQAAFLIGVSFVRCGGAYREVYDERRAHLRSGHPDWSRKHEHHAAIRATVKLFLVHLWTVWKEARGERVTGELTGARTSPWQMVNRARPDEPACEREWSDVPNIDDAATQSRESRVGSTSRAAIATAR